MMAFLFKNRFFHSILPFSFFMKTIGLFLYTDSPSQSHAKRLHFVWSLICFNLSFTAGVYHFFDQGVAQIAYAFSSGIELNAIGFSKIDAFSKFLETASSFTCWTLTFVTFVLTTNTTITLFCESLERLDHTLERPTLTSLRNISIIAVVWIFVTVNQQACPFENYSSKEGIIVLG